MAQTLPARRRAASAPARPGGRAVLGGRGGVAAPLAVLLVLAVLLTGCLLPKGPQVYVDGRHGKWWSGKGVLLETSEDGSWCKVAARSRALVVEKRWVDCRAVHRRFPSE